VQTPQRLVSLSLGIYLIQVGPLFLVAQHMEYGVKRQFLVQYVILQQQYSLRQNVLMQAATTARWLYRLQVRVSLLRMS
jgi:hypothetical protein